MKKEEVKLIEALYQIRACYGKLPKKVRNGGIAKGKYADAACATLDVVRYVLGSGAKISEQAHVVLSDLLADVEASILGPGRTAPCGEK